jgi:predicted small secreted protein
MKKNLSVFVLLALLTLSLSACSYVRGSGNVVSQERQVEDFERVTLSGVGTLYISQGDENSLTIEAEDNILALIESEVRGDTLEIGLTDWRFAIHPTMPIRYYLTLTDLTGLELSGAGRIDVDEIETSSLDVTTSGAGDIDIDSLEAESVNIVLSGAGSCEIQDGEVIHQYVTISGAGGYRALDLQSQNADIRVSGIGGARLWVQESLDVVISGAGSVEYFGRPSLSQTISGAGRVNGLGDH